MHPGMVNTETRSSHDDHTFKTNQPTAERDGQPLLQTGLGVQMVGATGPVCFPATDRCVDVLVFRAKHPRAGFDRCGLSVASG